MSSANETRSGAAAQRRDEIRDALKDAIPVIIAVVPFGIVFGAVARDTGLTLLQALGLSGAIYAGASQLVLLQLIAVGTPLWSILVAVVAVNFRLFLYSASLGRRLARFRAGEKALAFYFLVDPLFAHSETRSRRRPVTKSYYFTYGVLLYANWLATSALGFVFGALIGDQRVFGLDILLPVYFLAITMQFRGQGGFVPVFALSAVTSIAVYLTLGSPWHITIGGLAGIALAAALPPREPKHPLVPDDPTDLPA